MNILSIQNLEKTVDDEPLFSDISLGLNDNDKIGLVGNNGTGKSTFLKIINNQIKPDSGTVSKNNDSDIMALDQITRYEEGSTLASFLYQANSRKIATLNEYNHTSSELDSKRYSQLLSLCEKDGLWNIETEYRAYLTDLGVPYNLDRKMDELSGGEVKKAAIARIFALKPELMLLDEITNHLDIKAIEYVEKFLLSFKNAFILVSHDRYLVNNTCTTIWELSENNIFTHPGNYNEYLERKATRLDIAEKEQAKITSILRTELKWLSRGPQARTGKDKNRKERIEILLNSQKDVREKEQAVFSSSERRLGKKILEIENLSFSYSDSSLFENFSYSFKKGDKIGIIGPNGCGKSTLLNILTNKLEAKSGNLDLGVNTFISYYDQLSYDLKEEKTALETIEDIATRIFISSGELSASKFLENFGFPVKKQRTSISVFSGGEKRRLYLLSKLAYNPNFLILDEPTNDLDIKTIENLEEYITAFPGCVLIVSHDRAFLDLTCDYLFVFEDNKITLFPGSYTTYKNSTVKTVNKEAAVNTKQKIKERKLSYKERQEYEALESKIEEMENYILMLEESFSSTQVLAEGSLQERSEKYEKAKIELEEMTERYFFLAEIDS